MNFYQKLSQSWIMNDSLLCIGIDPDLQRMTADVMSRAEPFLNFSKSIIDQTSDLVCAYKFQMAHFSSAGREHELEMSIDYLKNNYPEICVILDSKRGDVGTTAEQYAKELFERYNADAVTVNPYMGRDSVEPFVAYKDKGVIILCKTSNPGSIDLQDLLIHQDTPVPLYEKVAEEVSTHWNKHDNCLLVMGGTWPDSIRNIRQKFPQMPMLIPGVGQQGADILKVLDAGLCAQARGLILSVSRSVIYAKNVREAALGYYQAIQRGCEHFQKTEAK